MNTEFDTYLTRKHFQYGTRFNPTDLSKKFIPYFNTGERIKIQTRYGEIRFGTVGVTTGWKPCFLLMHNKRCFGSSNLLSDADTIIAVKRSNKYEPLP